jgi:ankyrin repeat protein
MSVSARRHADVADVDTDGRRHVAARGHGPMENRRALVKEGADVVRYDGEGLTALHYAAYYGNVEIVRVLLELGGDAYKHSQNFQKKDTRNQQQYWRR